MGYLLTNHKMWNYYLLVSLHVDCSMFFFNATYSLWCLFLNSDFLSLKENVFIKLAIPICIKGTGFCLRNLETVVFFSLNLKSLIYNFISRE